MTHAPSPKSPEEIAEEVFIRIRGPHVMEREEFEAMFKRVVAQAIARERQEVERLKAWESERRCGNPNGEYWIDRAHIAEAERDRLRDEVEGWKERFYAGQKMLIERANERDHLRARVKCLEDVAMAARGHQCPIGMDAVYDCEICLSLAALDAAKKEQG